ncbi:nucleotidyl transferase AbiEii/AbiGii toxin family protein [Streptomyces sp. NPDC001118]
MDELHRRLIRIGLDALAEDYGYALAGGYAVQAHHIVNRISDDVDLFTPIERSSEMTAATRSITAAYEAAGYVVELGQQAPTYTRLSVTDPATGSHSKVELVAEFLHHAPVASELGPVLHRDDVAAGKTGALFTRAEVRDAIDVHGLLRAGYTREQLIELAAQNDAGFDRRMFADSLARVQRFTDKQFAAYGVDARGAEAIRRSFHEWQQELIQPASPRPTAHLAPSLDSATAPKPAEEPGPQHGQDHPQGPNMRQLSATTDPVAAQAAQAAYLVRLANPGSLGKALDAPHGPTNTPGSAATPSIRERNHQQNRPSQGR